MGEEAGRDGLEEDERGAGDQQHVEDEPGGRRPSGGADEQGAGADQDLLAEHHQQHRRGERAAAAEPELVLAGDRVRLDRLEPGRRSGRQRQDDQGGEGAAAMPTAIGRAPSAIRGRER